MKVILVTGCAGFIGSRFVEIFRERFPDAKVVGIDNLKTGKRERISKDIVFIEGSITDMSFLEKMFVEHAPEYVIHFAAIPMVPYCQEYPEETEEVNVSGTKNIFEMSKKYGAKKVVFSSSAAVYGNVEELPVKETFDPKPISNYGKHKLEGEKSAQAVATDATDIVCLRYFNVYGPLQDGTTSYSTVISRWLEAQNKAEPILINGDGMQTRDFIYIDNVVAANIAAMQTEKLVKGQPINIASGAQTSLMKIKEMIEFVSGKKLLVQHGPERAGDIRDSVADVERAKELLGWQAVIPLEKGLKETIEWFIQHHG